MNLLSLLTRTRLFTCTWKMMSFLFIKSYCDAKTPMKKIQIGCGRNIIKGWMNTDVHYTRGALYLDASKKMNIRTSSINYIFSEHVFEHLDYIQQNTFIKECFRVLKPGGILRIATPNLSFLTHLYSEKGENRLYKKYINWSTEKFIPGVAKDFHEEETRKVYVINNFFTSWGHRLIHDKRSISQLLEKNGFQVCIQYPGNSNSSELKKIERHQEHIGVDFNNLETMVIEGQKNHHPHSLLVN